MSEFAFHVNVAVDVIGAVMVSTTGTVRGVFVAPVTEMVMEALYVPAVRAPVATVRVIVPFPVPDAGESVNQAALSLADQVKVPPPVLLMLIVWAAGLTPV